MKDKKDKKEKIKKEAVEDKPEIEMHPRCTMELVENKETGGVDVVYSKHCSGGTVREVAGKIALDGVRFRPESEDKNISEKTKEEIKKEFDEKVSACELGKSETCESPESES